MEAPQESRASLPIPAHTPIARARDASSGKVRPMIASVPGSSRAVPTPWTTRAATAPRRSGLGETAGQGTGTEDPEVRQNGRSDVDKRDVEQD
jgi:hypothetical protein